MFTLIKNVDLYAPKHIGRTNILLAGDKVLEIGEDIDFKHKNLTVIDGKGKKCIPGLIDQHVHITGGGGEASFKTRVPELMLSRFIEAGITTVLGLLGTDSSTRNVENLYAKAKALNEEGITVYMLTGAYEYPSPTITGSIKKDVTFLDLCIGVKIAISDHRASGFGYETLADIALASRVGGMLSGKAGITTVHMGDHKNGLKFIKEAVEKTALPKKHFIPTHVNRNPELLEEALAYAKDGGYIDMTSGITGLKGIPEALVSAKEQGVPLENITVTSDGGGSWSNYDEFGNLVEIGVSPIDGTFKELTQLVTEYGWTLTDALQFMTTNTAKMLGLEGKKGVVAEGADADLVLVTDNYEIDTVIAKGQILMDEKEIQVYGTYESVKK